MIHNTAKIAEKCRSFPGDLKLAEALFPPSWDTQDQLTHQYPHSLQSYPGNHLKKQSEKKSPFSLGKHYNWRYVPPSKPVQDKKEGEGTWVPNLENVTHRATLRDWLLEDLGWHL